MTPRLFVVGAAFCGALVWLAVLFADSAPPFGATLLAQSGEPNASMVEAQVDPVLSLEFTRPVVVGTTTLFTATVSINPDEYAYLWSFGDGDTAIGRAVNHTYRRTGAFQVSVIATRGAQRLEAFETISVAPGDVIVPDEAIAELRCENNSPVEANNPVRLVASVARGRPVHYIWHMGDGDSIAEGAVVTHFYERPGRYMATVTASNLLTPNSPTCQSEVEILDETPMGLDIEMGGLLFSKRPVRFTAHLQRGTNVTFEWFVSDGTNHVGSELHHSFAERGNHTVTLRAANSRGALTSSKTYFVVGAPPTRIQGFNDSPKPPNTDITFGADVSSPEPVLFTWHWGDGSQPQTTASLLTTHRYRAAGKYGVYVVAWNEGGAVATTQIAYAGIDRPLVTGLALEGLLPLAPVNQPLQFSAVFSPTLAGGNYRHYRYTWDFGDSNITETTEPSVSHVYTQVDHFVLTVTATARVSDVTPALLHGATVVRVLPNIHAPLLARMTGFHGGRASDGGNVTPATPPAQEPDATATPETGPTDALPLPDPPTPTPSPTQTPTATPTATEMASDPLPIATNTTTPTSAPVEGGTIPPLPGP
ncbi:MAG: PKD domain-containing protein [Caldilineaceae bacterium]|nr:PKD domain-containing protein [Caldilineaceae bacterium]